MDDDRFVNIVKVCYNVSMQPNEPYEYNVPINMGLLSTLKNGIVSTPTKRNFIELITEIGRHFNLSETFIEGLCSYFIKNQFTREKHFPDIIDSLEKWAKIEGEMSRNIYKNHSFTYLDPHAV